MNKLLLIIFLLFAAVQTQAQTEKEKELQLMEQEVASGTLSDDEMSKKYELLMWGYRDSDDQKTRLYFNKAITFAREKKNVEWESKYLKRMGVIYNDWGENDTALIYLDNALKLIEGKDFYKEESSNYEMRGNYFSDINDHEKAMNAYLKALEINEKDKNKKISEKQEFAINIQKEVSLFVNMAGIYYRLFNTNKTIEYLLRAKKMMDDNPKIDFSRQEGKIFGNLANCYMDNGQYEKALPLLKKSYELAVEKQDMSSMVHALERLSIFYTNTKNYPQALHYAKEALQTAEKTKQPHLINIAERTLMSAYLGLKDFKKSLYYAENVLSRTDEDDWENLEDVYGELIKIYALLGDMEHSDDYLAKYKEVITKISDENLHSALQEMEVKYDVRIKEQKITRQQDEIKRQRNIFFASMAVALVIIGFTVYIIRLRNRRNRELVEMNEIKDKFFSIISHDLKNPAIAQRNALQLLLDNSDKWDTQSLMTYYYELLKSADSQVTLLYNLLNWAQVQTGRMPYSPVPFDLAAALQSDIALINNMAKQKNITFNLHTTESALVIGDANMLTTVVRNLLANAVKFTEKGGVVSLEIKTNENEECTVSISDTGMGMSATQIQNLFRIDRHNLQKGTSGEEGSGLGLIVCKELLQKHNSVLHIESEEKKGSKIWFKI